MPGTNENRPSALVYLDANTLIYLVEGDPETSDALVPLFNALRVKPGSAVTSELTLAEVLAPNAVRGKLSPDLKGAYLNLLIWGRFITLMPVTRDILYETAEVRSMVRLKLPDAIHLTTAIRAGCRFIMTGDYGLKVPLGMTRVEPDYNGVSRILESLG